VRDYSAKIVGFTKEQNHVTAAFLKHTSRSLGNLYGPNQSQKALKHYWKQFL
jgi:hypothetical protein